MSENPHTPQPSPNRPLSQPHPQPQPGPSQLLSDRRTTEPQTSHTTQPTEAGPSRSREHTPPIQIGPPYSQGLRPSQYLFSHVYRPTHFIPPPRSPFAPPVAIIPTPPPLDPDPPPSAPLTTLPVPPSSASTLSPTSSSVPSEGFPTITTDVLVRRLIAGNNELRALVEVLQSEMRDVRARMQDVESEVEAVWGELEEEGEERGTVRVGLGREETNGRRDMDGDSEVGDGRGWDRGYGFLGGVERLEVEGRNGFGQRSEEEGGVRLDVDRRESWEDRV